jgi:uncharacterized cofD-like protein
MKNIFQNWWKSLRYEPTDPRFQAGGDIKIAVIGGGTGLSNLLRGLKKYSKSISAIVTVADNGASTGEIRKEFDIIAPGDIRKCISALAYDEEFVSKTFEYRFRKEKRLFGGHTLGNIWITALSEQLGSFEKAIEKTSEIFQTAGKVLPSTLSNIDIIVNYADGSTAFGEEKLDLEVKKIKNIELNKIRVKAYEKAKTAIDSADLIIVGPGSLYGSILPNLLIKNITSAIVANKRAIKVYVANCSTERTQTAGYTIADHLHAIKSHVKKRLFDYCLVNNKILSTSKDDTRLGEVNNITSNDEKIDGTKIILADIINERNPLYHDSEKLAKRLIELYNSYRHKN